MTVRAEWSGEQIGADLVEGSIGVESFRARSGRCRSWRRSRSCLRRWPKTSTSGQPSGKSRSRRQSGRVVRGVDEARDIAKYMHTVRMIAYKDASGANSYEETACEKADENVANNEAVATISCMSGGKARRGKIEK